MFLVFLFVIFSTAGGIAITYLYDDDAPIIVRLAAGVVLGNAFTGLVGFLFANIIGLTITSVALATITSVIPLAIFRYSYFFQLLLNDLANFKTELQNFFARLNWSWLSLISVYASLVIMLWFFFERAMIEIRDGIGTGSTHNISDLPFHLLIINSFVTGQNFPPQNPIYTGVTFTYPYMIDFVTAMMNVLGASVQNAMFGQNFLLVISLIILLARFTWKLTNNHIAASIAPFLLLFDGGFGFLLFLRDAVISQAGIFGQLFNLTIDYTIRGNDNWRWGNSLTTLFITQRAFLLGMPLALIILTKVWELFIKESRDLGNLDKQLSIKDKKSNSLRVFLFLSARVLPLIPYLIVGLFAGMLPLIHAHTFAVVMGITALIAAMSFRWWQEWFTFFAAAGLIALPELLIAAIGSAAKAESFVGWQFGWDRGEANVFWFWLKNTGLFIPLLLISIVWLVFCTRSSTVAAESETNQINEAALPNTFGTQRARQLLLFYAPFLLCFIVPNLIRLAPWVWDNVKVLIYWFVASVPLVALLLAYLWQRARATKYVAVILLVALTLSGLLDVWRVAGRQHEHLIIPFAMIKIAAQLRDQTKPDEIIVSAPEYANIPVLIGRRWFLGWTPNVWSHGIDSSERQNIIRQIYAGGANADALIQQNNISYVIIGPLERKFTPINEAYFQDFPVIAQFGEYRVYKMDGKKP